MMNYFDFEMFYYLLKLYTFEFSLLGEYMVF